MKPYWLSWLKMRYMKSVFLISLFLVPILTQAQNEFVPETRSLATLDLGFSGVQLGGELKTAKTQTVLIRAGMMPLLYDDIDPLGYAPGHTKLGWSPALSTEYRFYYNYQRRMEKKKDIRNNAVNYAGYLLLYSFKPVGVKDYLTANTRIFITGPVWGFNRALGEKILFNLTLGPVYEKEIDNNADQITGYFDLRWSFIFN
jgi:hypothetical protein